MGVPRAIVWETRSTLKRRRWESQEPPLGRARHNANAAAPKANAQVGINGDSSRTVAFGAGRGVLQGDCEPRKSAFLSLPFRFHFTAAAQPPLHRLSSHLATEENGTTLSPRRSQPNRAACFHTLQPLLQPLRFAVALRAGPGDGCDIQTASSTVLLPFPHPGRGSFGSYASLSVCGTPPTILDLLSFDCLSKQRKRVANKLANSSAAPGCFESPLRRAAVDKFIHNPHSPS